MNKSTAIGGAAAATTVVIGIGIGASQSSHKPPTNREKLANFQFKEEDGCGEWLDEKFKEVDEIYKQAVVKCLRSKVLSNLVDYLGLKTLNLEGNGLDERDAKWNAKKSEILKILPNTNHATESDGLAQIDYELKTHCTTENTKEIGADFSDDQWTDYLTVCVKEDKEFKKIIGKKFWINEPITEQQN